MRRSIFSSLFEILLIIVFVVIATSALAAPFLVSDPYLATDGITNFQVVIDGAAAVDSAPVSNALKYDLAGIPVGAHQVKARACNIWGCSIDSSPFDFTKKIPNAPTLRIAP